MMSPNANTSGPNNSMSEKNMDTTRSVISGGDLKGPSSVENQKKFIKSNAELHIKLNEVEKEQFMGRGMAR